MTQTLSLLIPVLALAAAVLPALMFPAPLPALAMMTARMAWPQPLTGATALEPVMPTAATRFARLPATVIPNAVIQTL